MDAMCSALVKSGFFTWFGIASIVIVIVLGIFWPKEYPDGWTAEDERAYQKFCDKYGNPKSHYPGIFK
jgi:hypothetical protein